MQSIKKLDELSLGDFTVYFSANIKRTYGIVSNVDPGWSEEAPGFGPRATIIWTTPYGLKPIHYSPEQFQNIKCIHILAKGKVNPANGSAKKPQK